MWTDFGMSILRKILGEVQAKRNAPVVASHGSKNNANFIQWYFFYD